MRVVGGEGHVPAVREAQDHAQRGRTGRVQRDAVPVERQAARPVRADQHVLRERVQRGVQQRRVQCEVVRAGNGGLRRQRHLREQHAVATAPQGRQPLERRTVAEATGGQVPVDGVGLDALGTGRRPRGGSGGSGRVRGRRDEPGGVPRPGGPARGP